MPDFKKILLIEDEGMILDSYADYLKRSGFDVVKISDGYKALEALEEYRDDLALVILDLMIPALDGLEILRLRSESPSKYSDAPILILTNMANERVIKDGFDLGASAYLIKSELTMKSLVDEVKRIISS